MIRKKIENFWYYHKVKVFVGIFAFIAILVISAADSGGEADLEIGYIIGESEIVLQNVNEKMSALEELIEAKDKQKAVISVVPLTSSRLELEFAIGISHILLLDKETLVPFAKYRFFESLDNYVDKYDIDISDYAEVKADPDNKNEYRVYALPVKEMDILLEMGFPEDYYFTIRLPKEDESDDVMRNKNAHIILDYLLD
ncbi:MAG: hypothetical protein GX270_00565 [Clostridiaceae bacterium]|jgi:hypothetical protein|nr:hypothetical protein [Clostridiaceae bacterium]